MNFVKIDSISDVKPDKNGRKFKQFSLSSGATRSVLDEHTGKYHLLNSIGKSTTVNSWEKTYLDDTKHWLYDLKVGDLLDGTIYTANVEPYLIEDEKSGETREVSTYTGFVLGFDTDAGFESRVRRMILDNGRLPIETNATASMQVAKEHQSSNVVDELAKVSVEEQTDVEKEY